MTMETSEYHVVKFIDLPYDDIKDLVIVPKSWIWRNTYEDIVAISYPNENPAQTEKRVKNYDLFSKDWKIYRASVLFSTALYKFAFLFTKAIINTSVISTDKAADDIMDEVSAMVKSMTIRKSDELNKSDNEISDSRNKPSVSHVTASVKEEKDEENKEKDTEESDKYKSPKRILKSPYKKPPGCKLYDDPKNTLKFPNFIELVPESNVFIDADELKKCVASSESRNQLILALLRAIFTDKALVNHCLELPVEGSGLSDLAGSGSRALDKNATRAIVRFVKEIKGDKWTKCNPPNNKNNKLHDPKNTLRYPDLVRLMSDSNVLINAKKLKECKSSSEGSRRKLAQALMREIFTKEALINCSLCGEPPEAFDHSKSDTRPGLDEHAKEVILKFVETVKDDEGIKWVMWNRQSVKKAMYSELDKWRP